MTSASSDSLHLKATRIRQGGLHALLLGTLALSGPTLIWAQAPARVTAVLPPAPVSVSAPASPSLPPSAAPENPTPEEIPEISMHVGESFLLPTPQIRRVAVGSSNMLTAEVLDKKDVLFYANAPGSTTVHLWHDDGRYQRIKFIIAASDTQRILGEITTFLQRLPNVQAHRVGDKVIVEGDKLSDATLEKLRILSSRYPQVVNFTNPLGWEKMVLLDVKVVEFPKNELKQYGIKWNALGGAAFGAIWNLGKKGQVNGLQLNIPAGSGGPPLSSSAGPSTPIAMGSGLGVLGGLNMGIGGLLDLMAQQGKASVLAEPQLSARNGAKASFLAGGEYPYTVANINGSTVQFKPYGIKLDITPRVDHNGVIRATVDSEVSSLDSSLSTASGPGILIRRTSTEFNVQEGQTLVLAGLISRRTSESVDKVPLLGDLPVLGPLFRSKRFQNDETELVVFVTPSVIDSQSPALMERVERSGHRLKEQLAPRPHLTQPLQPGRDPGQPNTATPPAEPAAAPAPAPQTPDTPSPEK